MSHFAFIKERLNNFQVIDRLLAARQWQRSEPQRYTNPHSKEVQDNVRVITDQKGKVKLGIQDAKLIVDPWYMGDDYKSFLRDYRIGIVQYAVGVDHCTVEIIDEENAIVRAIN